jgi:hypothetical protein
MLRRCSFQNQNANRRAARMPVCRLRPHDAVRPISQHPFAGQWVRYILVQDCPFGIAGITDHCNGQQRWRHRQAR